MGEKGKEVITMPKIMISDVLSLIFSVFIHAVLLFVAYRAGHNDGYREGYLDDKEFEKTVQDTFRHVQPIKMDHIHGGDLDDP